MEESKLHIRHFILAKEFKIDYNASTFNAKKIYEYISANQYPSKFDLKGMLGICFLNPQKSYNIEIEILQEGDFLGRWTFRDVKVDRDYEIMNIPLNTDGHLYILKEGFIDFVIKVNDEIIGTQVVKAVKEEI
ncbi:hypothetical protein [Bacillus wiedmannii]|uniref:hypothetical protein n=1 Tax=Bacillus wiedmannii TaxID=1890302 RepID=UPI00086CC59D|nr:hypothetical protein [Bacillus wiedmannii]SCN34185.1 Protein of unknown function [Bacillus wiedmannii]